MEIRERLAALRACMAREGIDIYWIPSQDAHQSEYVADYWRVRAWFSGFTGSAGTLAVTQDGAYLWADGRYHIQAERQVAGTGITLYKWGLEGVPDPEEWLAANLKEGQTLGFDGRMVSMRVGEAYAEKLPGVCFKVEKDLADEVWADRPALPAGAVRELELEYCGESRADKFARVREHLRGQEADYLMLASLDDIAWLLNLRGSDILHTPVFYSYLLIGLDRAWLFVDSCKVSDEIRAHLAEDGVEVCPYDGLPTLLRDLPAGKVLLNKARINMLLGASIPDNWTIASETDITTRFKACKNPTEQENIRKAHVMDGVAMVRFIKWLQERVKDTEHPVDEWEAGQYLDARRLEEPNCFDLSFGTIAGYMANGASAHYSAQQGSAAQLKPEGLIVVDSGGQYYQGTTDITRTIVLGPVTDRMKKVYTLVLKGHLALGHAQFLEKTEGHYLDILARQYLWQNGMDYRHGTGHGVGYVLSVHEGPQNIGRGTVDVKLEPGMLISNEPGYYPEGEFGVRIENLVLVREAEKTVDGRFLCFETVTVCPYDWRVIDESMLTEQEKAWINEYHRHVYEALSPYLNREEREWLAAETRYSR